MLEAIMATTVVLVGLMILGLIAQVINQVRILKILQHLEIMERQTMMKLQTVQDMIPVPVTMTDQEILAMIQETPDLMDQVEESRKTKATPQPTMAKVETTTKPDTPTTEKAKAETRSKS